MRDPATRQKKVQRGQGPTRGASRSGLKPIRGLYAVRCRLANEPTVADALRELGSVRRLEPHHLLLVQLPDKKREAAALNKLRAWHLAGRVEFFTPVFRDEATQLQRIPTDEIILRFKPDVPAKRRASLRRKLGVNTLRQNEFVPDQCVVKVSKATGLKTLKVATTLAKSAEVEYATPNYISEFRR